MTSEIDPAKDPRVAPSDDDGGSGRAEPPSLPNDDDLRRLGDAELRPLLVALLRSPSITYQDMADALDIRLETARSWRSRNDFYRRLLLRIGRTRSMGGRPMDRFRLNPQWRAPVQRAVTGATEAPEPPLCRAVPQLDAVATLLERANEERVIRLSRAYGHHADAGTFFHETDARLQTQVESRTLRLHENVVKHLAELRSTLGHIRRTIDIDSREKRRQISDRSGEVVVASKEPIQMQEYFSHLPPLSFSGYGGALTARSDRNCDKRGLDTFLAERIQGAQTRADFTASIGLVVKEMMSLTHFDPSWTGMARQLFNGMSESPSLATLSSVRDAIKGVGDSARCDPDIAETAKQLANHTAEMGSLSASALDDADIMASMLEGLQ